MTDKKENQAPQSGQHIGQHTEADPKQAPQPQPETESPIQKAEDAVKAAAEKLKEDLDSLGKDMDVLKQNVAQVSPAVAQAVAQLVLETLMKIDPDPTDHDIYQKALNALRYKN